MVIKIKISLINPYVVDATAAAAARGHLPLEWHHKSSDQCRHQKHFALQDKNIIRSYHKIPLKFFSLATVQCKKKL